MRIPVNPNMVPANEMAARVLTAEIVTAVGPTLCPTVQSEKLVIPERVTDVESYFVVKPDPSSESHSQP